MRLFVRRHRVVTAALSALAVIAVIVSAFAHRAGPAVDQDLAYGDVEVAQYVLPDGTLPVLCLVGSGSEQSGISFSCEFCLIAGSSGLPTPVAGCGLALDYDIGRATGIGNQMVVATSYFSPSHMVRGPPLLA